MAKVLLGGFLLINPFLVALTPAYFSGHGPAWVVGVFPWILGFNILTFWFPLGFTFEVLRRARTGRGGQLPDWQWDRLGVFARGGAVKLTLAIFTLILPRRRGWGAIYGIFRVALGLPDDLLTLAVPPMMLFVIPFCGVACCRWLDGASVLSCALNYQENFPPVPQGLPGLPDRRGVHRRREFHHHRVLLHDPLRRRVRPVLVDTWFGPIYAESVARPGEKPTNPSKPMPVLATR